MRPAMCQRGKLLLGHLAGWVQGNGGHGGRTNRLRLLWAVWCASNLGAESSNTIRICDALRKRCMTVHSEKDLAMCGLQKTCRNATNVKGAVFYCKPE